MDSMMLRAFHSSLSEYLFSPLFQDSILGDGLVVGLLAKNDLSSRHFQDSTNLPEVATDHIVLHTAPVGRLIIQTLI